jgi:hypothetical protein
MAVADPAVDYTGRDFYAVKQSLLDYASVVAPKWTNRTEGSLDMTLVELFAYAADIQAFYADRIRMEAYLPTATQRLSLLYLAQLLGYIPHGPIPSTGTVKLVTPNPSPAVTVPAGTQLTTAFINTIDAPLIFETSADALVPANGGVVTANVVQGATQSDVKIATSTGNPSQVYQLPNVSVIDGTVSVTIESTTDNVTWTHISYLVDAQPTDLVYTTFTDANGLTWIQFGDGVNGAIPTLGLDIYATYRIGGGVIGNIPAGSVTTFASDDVNGIQIQQDANGVYQSSAMVGGADPESNDSIRANAPLSFRTQQRAVTIQDFNDMALSVPGVTKASAVATHYTSVTMYITGPGGTAPTSPLIAAVRAFFSTRMLAGVSLTVSAANVIPVNFGTSGTPCQLFVLDRYSQSAVLSSVIAALQNFFSPANVNFGQRISLSQVYAALQGISGVAYLYIPMMARSDAAQTGTADVLMRTYEIPAYGTFNVTASGGAV